MSWEKQVADQLERIANETPSIATVNDQITRDALDIVGSLFPGLSLAEVKSKLQTSDVVLELHEREPENNQYVNPDVRIPGPVVLATVIKSFQHVYEQTGSLDETFRKLDNCDFQFSLDQGMRYVNPVGDGDGNDTGNSGN